MLRTFRQRKLANNFNEFLKIEEAPPVFARARVNLGRTRTGTRSRSNASGVNKDLIFLIWLTKMGTQGRLLVAYDDVAGAESVIVR
jgi:hypothetical protein